MDPKSEIIHLSDLLSDSSSENQEKAVRGLFEIGDEKGMLVLWNYFFENPERATSPFVASVIEWIWKMKAFGEEDGIRFCIELIKLRHGFYSQVAFEQLQQWIYEGTDISKFSDGLKVLAINSKDPLVRARAKLLLDTKQKVEKEGYQRDARSIPGILLDIEAKVDSLIHKKE